MTEIVKTVCGMCGDSYAVCGLDVYVENGRAVRIKGMKEHPTNKGTFLCVKALAAIQLLYDLRRLLYPLKRVGQRGENKYPGPPGSDIYEPYVNLLLHAAHEKEVRR